MNANALSAPSRRRRRRSPIERVSHAYGARKALDDVSFSVEPGAFAVLLGLNGAGKSTLFSIVTHLYASKAGAVRIFGHDVARRERRGARRARRRVPEPRRSTPISRSSRTCSTRAPCMASAPRESRTRARELVGRVGLADRLKDRVRTLSGGQARRVEIARALLHGPASCCSTSRPPGSTSRRGRTSSR